MNPARFALGGAVVFSVDTASCRTTYQYNFALDLSVIPLLVGKWEFNRCNISSSEAWLYGQFATGPGTSFQKVYMESTLPDSEGYFDQSATLIVNKDSWETVNTSYIMSVIVNGIGGPPVSGMISGQGLGDLQCDFCLPSQGIPCETSVIPSSAVSTATVNVTSTISLETSSVAPTGTAAVSTSEASSVSLALNLLLGSMLVSFVMVSC